MKIKDIQRALPEELHAIAIGLELSLIPVSRITGIPTHEIILEMALIDGSHLGDFLMSYYKEWYGEYTIDNLSYIIEVIHGQTDIN